MTNKELSMIYGGYKSSDITLVNALIRLVNIVYGLGRKLGTSIRKVQKKTYC